MWINYFIYEEFYLLHGHPLYSENHQIDELKLDHFYEKESIFMKKYSFIFLVNISE